MPPEPTVLAFDTSAAHCAAALLFQGEIVAHRLEPMARGQAERLFPMLEEVLGEAGQDWRQIDLIGVGIGPGNFTGVRIAVSAARGLALSLAVPAIGVSTFESLAWGRKGTVIASVSAPREAVYAAVVDTSASPSAVSAPRFGEAAVLDFDLPEGAAPFCIGAEADVFARRFSGRAALPSHDLADAVALVAGAQREFADLRRPSPLYVRAADALPASEPPPVILP